MKKVKLVFRFKNVDKECSQRILLILAASESVRVIFFLMISSSATKDMEFRADDIVLQNKYVYDL